MEELSQIVAQSMARHGCDSTVDHRRLAWSPWIRCQWDDSLLLVPSAGGILALAEDVGTLGSTDGAPCKPSSGLSGEGQRQTAADRRPTSDGAPCKPSFGLSGEVHPRVLALFEIAETDDLGTALLSLFAPQSGYRDRVRSGRCFVRFAAVADPAQRQVAARALREWLHNTEPISRLETMPQTTSASASDQTTEDEDTTKERTTAA